MTDEMISQLASPGPQAGQSSPSETRDEAAPSLSHLLTILASRKRLIGGATLAGGVLAAAVAFLLPNTYTASAVIMSPQKEQSMMSMLAGQLGPLAAVAGADLALKNPADLYVGLLGSRTIADDLIGQFGLQVLYRAKSNVEARDELKSHSRFNTGRDSLIRIEVDDRDPRRAAAIANAFVSELAAQNKRLALTESGQRRAFLEKQLTDEKANLATAEDAMKGTQQRTGVIDVGGQAGLAIASLAQIRAEITAHEVALERLKMSATPQNPDVLATEAELDALRAQFRNLDKISGGPLISASAVPAAGLTYVRSLRELKYHEFLYEMLAKQYEAARLDENKSAPALQIVDIAIPPDRKSGPHRSLITILGCFGGAAMAMIAAYVQWQRR